MDQIINGTKSFKQDVYPQHEDLFKKLANTQAPEVLFITCADSRIDPSLITQSKPGDLFVCRNAGNIVPPHSAQADGMTASIEYAVAALGVKHIIICGHTDCGAMKGAMNKEALKELPHVSNWLSNVDAACRLMQDNCDNLNEHEKLNKLTEENVLAQLQHLKTHPYVNAKLDSGQLTLHGWIYNIEHGTFSSYDSASKSFQPLSNN